MDVRRAALSGALPKPVESTELAGEHALRLDLFGSPSADVVVASPDHRVVLFLRAVPHLVQERDGRRLARAMRPGDMVITPCGSPKRWCHQCPAQYLVVRFPPAFLRGIAERESGTANHAAALRDVFHTRDAHLERLCKRMREELASPVFGSRLYAEALALQFGVHLLRHYCDERPVTDNGAEMLSPHKLRRATEFIHENLRADLTIDRIATELAMSPFHFARAFRKAAGVAPHRYVVQCRLDRAMSLLRDTDLPVTEVSHLVGFTNSSHFCVVFHRATGQTPRRYRHGC